MIKIALIDDHTIVRSGFAQLLNLEQDIVVASEFDSAKDADSASFVKKALDAGAQGYLSKRCGPSELASAIRTVASGKRYLCADALINLSNPDINNVLVELTKRELEVFDQLIKGKEVKEIAQHRANILSKLNLTNNVDLIRFAIHHHLLAEG